MNTVYITGHRNPDCDSIVSAHVYAHFKGRVDPDNKYIPVRCGSLNPQTRAVFSKLGIEPPRYMKDVKTTVSHVVDRDVPRLRNMAPLQTAISTLDERDLSILPVFDDDGQYKGIVSGAGVSHFLMQETLGVRPIYRFHIENLTQVVPGRILRLGEFQDFTAPVMIGAMSFERSVERIAALESNRPMLIVGFRRDLVEYAIEHDFPALILTGALESEVSDLDFSQCKGSVYLSDVDTAETIRLLRFSTPLEVILETDVPRLNIDEDFDTAKAILADLGLRGLPVFEGEQFAGIVSRNSFLFRPRNKLILVDHNEFDQSIPGARYADILEIIDHHRFGSLMSSEPCSIFTKPVGCTSTILRQFYRQYGIAIPADIALLMLSAILSDTIMLKSPTTTEEDKQTVEGLARHAGVDWREWGQFMFDAGTKLADLDPETAVNSDFKLYTSENYRFGIGQVEVQSLSDLTAVAPGLLDSLERVRMAQALDSTMLMITDVVLGDSILLYKGLETMTRDLPYEELFSGALSLPDILSRKKQLVPDVLRAIEETKGKH